MSLAAKTRRQCFRAASRCFRVSSVNYRTSATLPTCSSTSCYRPFASAARNDNRQKQRSSPRVSAKQRNAKSWKKTQQECHDFLQHIKDFPSGIVALRVKEMLVQILSTPPHPEKGLLAAQLLEVAKEDLDSIAKTSKGAADSFELRAKLYQMTIEAWVSTGIVGRARSDAWDNAERLLWEMLSNHASDFLCPSVKKNVDNINGAFAAVLFAFCKVEKKQLCKGTIKRLEPVIHTVQQLWKDQRVKLVPDSVSMDAILYYYFKLQQPDKANQILQEEIIGAQPNNRFLKPTLHGMNTVISSYAIHGNVRKVREILELMLAESARKGSSVPSPNVVSFNGLLNAVAKRGDSTAGVQAKEVLEWMANLSIQPDTISYTTAISAWNKSRDPLAAERAEGILRRMIDLQTSGTHNVAPNEVTFSSVIHAWAISGREDAAERAVAIMELMKALTQEQYLPREKLTSAFNSLLLAFAKSKKPNTTDKVFELLQQMNQVGVMPDATTHNATMGAIMNNGSDGPYKALQYFLNLETKFYSDDSDVKIDTYSYNLALDALSKFGDRGSAPEQALELLGRMLESCAIEPDTATYNIVMKILAKSSLDDSAVRAEQLLNEMEEASRSGDGVRPSGISYATCISAWGYTRSPDRYRRMRQLLLRMEAARVSGNHAVKPNAVPFNAVFIACCCGSDEREMALSCVLETADHLRRTPGVIPNQNTYPVLLRAIGLNTPPGERRNYLLSKELENCIKDGLVDEEVIRALQDASPQVLLGQVPVEDGKGSSLLPTLSNIPKEWKRNVSVRASKSLGRR